MRNSLQFFFVGLVAFSLVNAEALGKKPISPEMCISYKILDDAGRPVPDVSCRGWIREFDIKGGGRSYSLMSDTNGIVTIHGKCSVSFTAFFMKEGYYMSRLEPCLDEDGKGSAIVDGKWQPYGETRTVVLKRIKNPYAVKVFSGEQCHRKIPVFEQWLPFDMEQSDWLAPYGKGKYGDVLLRFEKAGSGRVGDFAYSMEACFTNNPHAGFYCKPMDEFSDLKTDYHADTNANYSTRYRFLIDVINKHPPKQIGCADNSYLVFRTRTRVDENGNLVGAHYGKYCEGWSSDAKEMQFGSSCFNPVENDTNIEGDQPLFYKLKNRKK